MECAAKLGSGSTCAEGPPTRRCGLCGAVGYCSKVHQLQHWEVHKEECQRLAKQMRDADLLDIFPFTFYRGDGKQEARCSILTTIGLHQIGIWKSECSCGPLVASSERSRISESWELPCSLCPCAEPRNSVSTCISGWEDYYKLRCLPLYSPAALLLHWPLTVNHSFQVSGIWNLISRNTSRINIHYIGPEKELLQLGVFGELRALIPHVELNMDIIGPTIPQCRNGEVINLSNYMRCSGPGDDCYWRDRCASSTSDSSRTLDIKSAVTIKLHKGLYHEVCKDINEVSYPHLVVALNAGIAAYSSWIRTIEVLNEMKIPAIFTDFCEEAANLAAHCITSVTKKPLRIPVQLNPFRQPLAVEDSALYLPCYSNCFIFGM